MIISRGDVSTSKIEFFETTYLECAFLEVFVYIFCRNESNIER